MKTLGLLHGAFERNWACDQADYQARADTIEQMPHFASRSFDKASLALVHRFPQLVGLALQREVPDGLEVLGAGTQHTVLADSEKVIKINRRSVFMNTTEKLLLMEEAVEDHALLAYYIGGIALPQTTNIYSNPLNLQKHAVAHLQQRIDYQSLSIFPSYGTDVKTEELHELVRQVPNIQQVLDDLAVAGLEMFRAQTMVPDISGPDNMVLTGQNFDELICIDGLPVRGDTDPKGTIRIAALLHDLRSKL